MLKKKLGWFLVLIFVIPLFFVFRKNNSNINKNNNNKEIVASCFPVYNIARELLFGVNDFRLTNLTSNYLEGNSCLHNYSLTTDNAKSLENASVVIINGADFEPFVDKIPENKLIINASENINLDSEKNPYVWISINNYIDQINTVSNKLSDTFPNYRNVIIKNSSNYCKKLSDIKSEWDGKLSNFKGIKIASLSEKFDYLLKEFGLIPLKLRSSHSHETMTSADVISSAVKEIKENNFKFFISTKNDINTNKVIEKESGAQCIILRSLDNPADGSYIDQIKNNLSKIYEAVSS